MTSSKFRLCTSVLCCFFWVYPALSESLWQVSSQGGLSTSPVAATFNITTGGATTRTSNSTLVRAYADAACGVQLGTAANPGSVTFSVGRAAKVNGTSIYLLMGGTVRSIRVDPLGADSSNIFNPSSNCFPVTCDDTAQACVGSTTHNVTLNS
jgi:hypothetical protein